MDRAIKDLPYLGDISAAGPDVTARVRDDLVSSKPVDREVAQLVLLARSHLQATLEGPLNYLLTEVAGMRVE